MPGLPSTSTAACWSGSAAGNRLEAAGTGMKNSSLPKAASHKMHTYFLGNRLIIRRSARTARITTPVSYTHLYGIWYEMDGRIEKYVLFP